MKKFILLFVIISVIATGVVLAVGGFISFEKIDSSACESHVDSNGDLICDECQEALTPENQNEPQPEEPPKQEAKEPDRKPVGDGETNTPAVTPCQQCVDLNENLICDVCGTEIEIPSQDVTLIRDGEATFSILLEYESLSEGEILSVRKLIDHLDSIGVSPQVCSSAPAARTETEIIINSVSYMGDSYETNPYYLGPNGYAVKVENGKIFLMAGSSDTLEKAISYLIEKAFTLADNETKLQNSVFSLSDSVEIIQTDYKYSTILVGNSDIRDYAILCAPDDSEGLELAEKIRNLIYEGSGIRLEILSLAKPEIQKYITVKISERSGDVGFYVTVCENGNLEIVSEFKNKTVEAGKQYLNSVFASEDDTLFFTSAQINIRDVYYKDFGATGDGVTDDFNAIKAAHDYANEHGHTVVAENHASYYMGKNAETVKVRTNTFWNGAIFIIDDTDMEYGDAAATSVFTIASDSEPLILTSESEEIKSINSSGGLSQITERIDLKLGYSAVLIISCGSRSESLIVDENGYISGSDALSSEFGSVDSITVIKADDSAITVQNGSFISKSNGIRQNSHFARNIRIMRSNTVILSVNFEITDEPLIADGASPYLAFIEIFGSYNVSVSGISFTARALYAPGEESPIISAKFSHGITIANCHQQNFFKADGYTVSDITAGAICIYSSRNVSFDRIMTVELFLDEFTENVTVRNSTLSLINSQNAPVISENNVIITGNIDN